MHVDHHHRQILYVLHRLEQSADRVVLCYAVFLQIIFAYTTDDGVFYAEKFYACECTTIFQLMRISPTTYSFTKTDDAFEGPNFQVQVVEGQCPITAT